MVLGRQASELARELEISECRPEMKKKYFFKNFAQVLVFHSVNSLVLIVVGI
jgi:hypothetical protein